jgi:hypothetical protein
MKNPLDDEHDAAIGDEMQARKLYMEARVAFGADSPEAQQAKAHIDRMTEQRQDVRTRHDQAASDQSKS